MAGVIYGPTPDGTVSAQDDDALAVGLDPDTVLPRRIALWAERDPGRPFLSEATGRAETFGDVEAAIRRWVTLLRTHGVQAGDRVISLLPSSIDAHLLWLAAGTLRAVEVPVNPELRGEFLRHALTDPGARLVFARPESIGLPATVGRDDLEVVTVPRDEEMAKDVEPAKDIEWPGPLDTSCVIYTSGTTGPSKGVIVTWGQMSATIGRIPRSWLSGDDIVYCSAPMFHVTGRTPMISMAELGGQVVFREKFSIQSFWDDIKKFGCTSTTALAPLLLGAPERPDDLENPLRVCFGGPSGPTNRRFGERFGLSMVSCYGSTEAGFPIVLRWPDPDGGCGVLRRGYQAKITDEDGRELPDGEPGELWIKPPAPPLVTLGYLNQPELTARSLVDGWYRTGDSLIRWPDGHFEFVDRLRDTIRKNGENISSSALETVVVTDPEVLECVAIGVPNDLTGQDILLAVIPRPEAQLDPAELFGRLLDRLPRYMHPAYIVVADAFPRTPNGKARKVGLLEQLDLEHAWRSTVRAGSDLSRFQRG